MISRWRELDRGRCSASASSGPVQVTGKVRRLHVVIDKVVYQVVGGSLQVVGFFDVAARLCAGEGPIVVAISGHR